MTFYLKPIMKLFIIMLLVLSVSAQVLAEIKLASFTTDGCSSFPDGTLEHRELWLSCCTAHDLAYWQGGTAEQRENADIALERCVSKVGEPAVAALMLAGVRVGGSPYWPTKFRWGYGWPFLRGYKALSDKEKLQVQLRLTEMKQTSKKKASNKQTPKKQPSAEVSP